MFDQTEEGLLNQAGAIAAATGFEVPDLSVYYSNEVPAEEAERLVEELVMAMYFSALSKQSLGRWVPFPNYLYARPEAGSDSTTPPPQG